ncbi:MAG TPA: AAA family ATPase [Thermoanaerobaculia bacterium]|nr:AAA family ATPase [Thermoanaerobaculia bacterium]
MPFSQDPYLRHFQLEREPFGLTPGVEHLYLGKQHAEALAGLQLGIRHRRGLIVLVGEVGMGKTTLAHAVIRAMDERVHIGYTANTTLGFLDMMRPALVDLGLTDCLGDKARLIYGLTEMLTACDQRDEVVALIVDEAHNLSPEVFEELRLLLNVENDRAKLLQLVLIGQPELEDRLAEHRLRHLADRVAVRCVLNPLSAKESWEYVEARLASTGASHDLFSRKAMHRILLEARGVPRAINVLCHNALLFAYGDGHTQVGQEHAKTAIAERRGGRLKRFDRKPRRDPRPRLNRSPRPKWLRQAALTAAGIAVGLLIGLAAFRAQGASGAATSAAVPPAETEARRADELTGAPGPMPPSSREVAEGAALAVEDDREPTGRSSANAPAPEADGHVIVVERGQSLSGLMLDVYGDFNERLLERVLDANPGIEEPDVIHEGQRVVLP